MRKISMVDNLTCKNTYYLFYHCLNQQATPYKIQVNLCQKHSFSNQLTHNITTDCSLIPDFSTRKIQLQNMLCTNIVFCFCFGLQNNVCTQHVLSLYFSCTEFRNEWTICRHIVGYLIQEEVLLKKIYLYLGCITLLVLSDLYFPAILVQFSSTQNCH